jgi:putative peptidoglycan lipid II flippase
VTGSLKVASGILLSRLSGFVRDAALAYYFGAGPHADVFRTVLRGPNVLQNLLGEQTLSASFIPVYSRLVDEEPEAAGRFAGAIFGLLLVVVSALVLTGVLLAGPIVALLAPGYLADSAGAAAGVDRYALAVRAVRWIFPMTGVLVLSAWVLGILNSHRRLFLPYVAPVAWNAAIVAALVVVGRRLLLAGDLEDGADALLIAACQGALVGGVLQLVVQLPAVMMILRGFRLSLSRQVKGVSEALRAFGPLVAGKGVVQLSGYLDLLLASFLAVGAVGALGWAYTLYVLPVSLFGMSVAAAELPELSRQTGEPEREAYLARLAAALRSSSLLVVPTLLGYLLFGYLIVATLFRRGSFGAADNSLVYLVLCAYSLGLLATVWSRILGNAFYARGETATPARIAVARVTVSALAGIGLMLALDGVALAELSWLDQDDGFRMGAVGLALGSALGATVELFLLRRAMRRSHSEFGLPVSNSLRHLIVAVAATLPALVVWWSSSHWPFMATGPLVVGCYAATYLLVAWLAGFEEARRLIPARLGRKNSGD